MNPVEVAYRKRYEAVLLPLAVKLNAQLLSHLDGQLRLDVVKVRAKSIDRFVAKAEKEKDGIRKYADPLNQIQDQVAARIVTFYLSDVERISKAIGEYYRAIEAKTLVPDSDSEFGYFGKHFVFFIPTDLVDEATKDDCPKFFELQVKTLFQHAWAEAEHDLGYKPNATLLPDQRRRIAFTAAQAWGADQIFEELHSDVSTAK